MARLEQKEKGMRRLKVATGLATGLALAAGVMVSRSPCPLSPAASSFVAAPVALWRLSGAPPVASWLRMFAPTPSQ